VCVVYILKSKYTKSSVYVCVEAAAQEDTLREERGEKYVCVCVCVWVCVSVCECVSVKNQTAGTRECVCV
jgi:hypothetical protein